MYLSLLLALAVYLVCLAVFGYRSALSLREITILEKARIRRYQISMTCNILSALAVLSVAAFSSATVYDMGVRPFHLAKNGMDRILGVGTLLVAGFLTALFLYQIVAFLCSPKFRQEQVDSLCKRRNRGNWYDRVVDNLIPRSMREKKWFGLSALVAGISEELVFRGFTLWLLESSFSEASVYWLSVIAGGLFGLAHFYQGAHGVIKTALLGILFGFLYLGTDTILVGALLHILFDLSSIFLYDASDHEY